MNSLDSYSSVEHLARTLWLSRYSDKNHMAMISAYLDESGHPDEGSVLVVSGFASSVEQWAHFEREWTGVLLEFAAPSIFHMNEFVSRSDGFSGWPKEKLGELLSRLLGIIARRTFKSFSCAIHLADFNKVNNEVVLAEMVGYPYALAGRACVAKISKWAQDQAHSNPIEYVFEGGAKHRGQLMYFMERDNKPTPVFKKKKESVQCQAADLLAWSQHNALSRYYERQLIDVHRAFEHFVSLPNDWGEIFEKDLMTMCAMENVTLRDREFTYSYNIVRRKGKRMPVLTATPKALKGTQIVRRGVDKRTHDKAPFKLKTDYAIIEP